MENLTNINFMKEEMDILNYGAQYSIGKPVTSYLPNVIVETEKAIKLLDTKMQNLYQILAAEKLKQIINKDNSYNVQQKRHSYIVKQIKNKLVTGNAMLIQADKGKTIVIITQNVYIDKVHTFLAANNFLTIPKDPTKKYQTLMHKTLQHCNLIIDKHKIKHLTQKRPTPPILKARIKAHKPAKPIRPVININTPSYKVAKHLTNILNIHLNFKNLYNVMNSVNLAAELTQLRIKTNYRLMAYDIKDLFVNIPINEVTDIIKSMFSGPDSQITTQIIELTKVVLSQNYFMFQDKIYHTNKGVAMGSPISSLIAEIFIQHYENTYLKHILDAKNIRYYTKYVDDILIIYDKNRINHESITQQINQIHKDMRFNSTHKTINTINFLDLQITRNTQKLEIYIYTENPQLQTPPSTTHQTTLWNTKQQHTDITFHECIPYH